MAIEALSNEFDISRADMYWPGASPIALHAESFEGRIKPPVGSKTFVMRGQLLGGHWSQRAGGRLEWAWVTREEAEAMMPSGLFSSIRSALSY
jgi:hypothetical protein